MRERWSKKVERDHENQMRDCTFQPTLISSHHPPPSHNQPSHNPPSHDEDQPSHEDEDEMVSVVDRLTLDAKRRV